MVQSIYAGFLIPVIDGELWLSQRNTEPHKGLYGPAAGKSDKQYVRTTDPWMVEKLGGHRVPSIADQLAEQDGREYPLDTAVREFWEELFSGKTRGQDDVTNVIRLGKVIDKNPSLPGVEFVNYVHLAHVTRSDYCLSAREVSDFKPLRLLREEQLYPIAKIALTEIRFWSELGCPGKYAPYAFNNLHEQIPEFADIPFLFTTMGGAFLNPSFDAAFHRTDFLRTPQ